MKRGEKLAGNDNSGRNVQFSFTENALDKHIKQYKNDVENGTIVRASWPHFCATLDCTEQEIAEVMALAESNTSAYKGRGKLLKKMATWMRGQMMSSAGWNGQMTARAIFALKQDMGDGVKWTDRETAGGGPSTINVLFGGDDSRGKKAGL